MYILICCLHRRSRPIVMRLSNIFSHNNFVFLILCEIIMAGNICNSIIVVIKSAELKGIQ